MSELSILLSLFVLLLEAIAILLSIFLSLLAIRKEFKKKGK